MVNRVGLLWVTLLTLLSFSCFHTFQDGGPGMIWDANSSKMEEPKLMNKNELWDFAQAP
jgi:hypothetical protein